MMSMFLPSALVVLLIAVQLATCQVPRPRNGAVPSLDSTIRVHPLSFGDTNIVATVPLRSTSGCIRTASDTCEDCLDSTGVQLAAAFHFAVDQINRRDPLPSGVRLGALLANSLTTCSQRSVSPSSTLGASLTNGLITTNGDNFLELLSMHRQYHRVLSMIDLVDVDDPSRTTIEGMVYVLLLFSTPEILLSSPPGTTIIPTTDPLLMRFEPIANHQITAIAYLIRELRLERVIVAVSANDQYWSAAASTFSSLASEARACIGGSVRLLGDQASDSDYLGAARSINDLAAAYAQGGASTAFVLLATEADGQGLFQAMLRARSPNVFWIATEPWHLLSRVFNYRALLQGMLVVADRPPPGNAARFRDYYADLIQSIRDAPPAGPRGTGTSGPMMPAGTGGMPTGSNGPPGALNGTAATTSPPVTTQPLQTTPQAGQPTPPMGSGPRPTGMPQSSTAAPTTGQQLPSMTPGSPQASTTTSSGPSTTSETAANASSFGTSGALNEILHTFVQQQLTFCADILGRPPMKDVLNSRAEFEHCEGFMATTPRLALAQRAPFLIDAVRMLSAGLHQLLLCNRNNTNATRCQINGAGTPADSNSFIEFIERVQVLDGSSGFRNLQFTSGQLDSYQLGFFNLQNLTNRWAVKSVGSVTLHREANKSAASSSVLDQTFSDFTIGDTVLWPRGTGRPDAGNCEPLCARGSYRVEMHPPPHLEAVANECCWVCAPCAPGTVTNRTNEESCGLCRSNERSNTNRTRCLVLPVVRLAWSDTSAIIVLCVSGLIFFFTVLVAAVFVHNRDTPVIRSSSFELSMLALMAIGLQVLVAPVYFIEPSEVSCEIGFALFFTIYTMMTSTLLMKSYKIWYIFQAKKHLDKSELFFLRTTFQILCICVLTGITVAMVTIIAVLDQITATHQLRDSDQLLVCDEADAMFFIMIGYTCIITLVSLVLAFKVRKLPARFNDAHFLMITFSVSLIVFLFLIIISQQSAGYQNPLWFPVTAAMWSFAALGSLFVPKVYIVIMHPEKNTRVTTFSHTATKMSLPSVVVNTASATDSPLSKPRLGHSAFTSSTLHTKSVDFDNNSSVDDLDAETSMNGDLQKQS